jgi:hypothetical protein
MTDAPLLVRLDSAHDALDNRHYFRSHGVDYLIKWNPRKQDGLDWVDKANAAGSLWCHTRPGKMETLASEPLDGTADRLIVKVTVRQSDAKGQLFLEPEISLEGWTTSLKPEVADNATVIDLYRDHATCEQFHSEFKSDLDLERLPSGKFDTNDLVMAFAVLGYNILRWMGQRALLGPDAPVRHKAKRRRIKTVMQELMYMACRLVSSGRRLTLRFGRHCPGFKAFGSVYGSA